MITHPEVQKRAQEEIDCVVGTTRLPDLSDRHQLPYIDAIYRELLRYNPPAFLGLPHTLTVDDVYEGFFLPKGAFPQAGITLNIKFSFPCFRNDCVCKYLGHDP
jgi:cytochrome P450